MYGRRNLPGIMGAAGVVSGVINGIGPLLAGLIAQATGSYNAVFLMLVRIYVLQAILVLVRRPTKIEIMNLDLKKF